MNARRLAHLIAIHVAFSASGALAQEPFGVATSTDALRLAITLSKTDCVAREPLRLRAILTNVSSELVGVVEVGYVGRQMDCFYMEVVTPAGAVEQRVTTWFQTSGVTNPSYPGEPLKPGDSIEVFFYPAYSDSRVWTGRIVDPFTFGSAGVYRLTLVYDVSRHYPVLADGTGIVRSNEVVLAVRDPNAIEERILDALWEGDALPSLPETSPRADC